MANAGLNLPAEIVWERLCASRDMMDQGTCDGDRPAKWSSSLALFRYVPEDEYQIYPGRRITYLKLVCTISGFQPKDKEIQGRIEFDGISLEAIEQVDALLESYLPCHGALVQVTVGLKPGVTLPLEDYPYVMDFQPKKRELYETVTQSGEFMSRTLETQSLRTAAGTTESSEVLDVDQGFNVGGGVGGVEFQYGRQGQWGTKHLSSGQGDLTRTSDESRERRETRSHTTQLTQMRHLFQGYHLGTNRALFFIQPRPHVLEEPSGFVRGPRPVEGMQEILLVLNHPEEQTDLCVSVRLDTSHLVTTEVRDYDRTRSELVQPCAAVALAPSQNDPARQPVPDFVRDVGFFKFFYSCFTKTERQTVVYRSPWSDYKIDVGRGGGYRTVVDQKDNGSSSVVVSPDGESLTITCEATSKACYYRSCTMGAGPAVCAPDLDTVEVRSGFARRTVVANLISREKIVKLGSRRWLLVTTRGLCCCPGVEVGTVVEAEGVVDYLGLGTKAAPPKQQRNEIATISGYPTDYEAIYSKGGGGRPAQAGGGPTPTGPTGVGGVGTGGGGGAPGTGVSTAVPAVGGGEWAWPEGGAAVPAVQGALGWTDVWAPPFVEEPSEPELMTTNEANVLAQEAAEALLRSGARRRRAEPGLPVPVLQSEYFADQLFDRVSGTRAGRALLRQSTADLIPPEAAEPLKQLFGRDLGEVTRGEVAEIPLADLAALTGLSSPEASRLRLTLLGVPTKEPG